MSSSAVRKTGHFMKRCTKCSTVYAFRVDDRIPVRCTKDGCNGSLEQVKNLGAERDVDPSKPVLVRPDVCVILSNGECVSPWACVHGGPLNPDELRTVIQQEVNDTVAPYRKSLKLFLQAARGQTDVLTPTEISTARDLTDDNGI